MLSKVRGRDLARLAGVSSSTVSRVLNGSARVSPEIQERVKNAAAQAGIKVEQSSLTKPIAFLLGNRDFLHPFHSRVLVGAEAFCSANNYSIVFLPFHYRSDVPWQELHLP
jgi:LacI family transcriptional regulator